MLLSCLMITSSYEKIKIYNIENYNDKEKKIAPYILFYGAILFLILELILFIYALIIAKNCSRNKHELTINVILSIIFTTPYVFFSMMSNLCAKDLLIKI